MKKLLAIMLAALMVLSFAACGATTEEEGNDVVASVEGTPTEIIEKIYAENPVELAIITMDLAEMDAEMVPMYTGLADSSKVKEGAFSESMMGAQAYSLVVVRVNDAADAETVATEMLNGIDTRKWICVEADDLVVAAYGDVIMLYMVDSTFGMPSEDMVAAFNTVCGGEATVYTR